MEHNQEEEAKFQQMCNDIGITLVPLAPSDFEGRICGTDDRCEMRSRVGDVARHKLPAKPLYYYVQSMPHVEDSPDEWVGLDEFEAACREWTNQTGIVFVRCNLKEAADFRLRAASATEEEEANETCVVESFCWASHPKHHLKVLKMWQRLVEWDAYAVFLHAVGHILGMRHEDAYRSTRTTLVTGGGTVLSSTSTTLQKDACSIMSREYLERFRQAPQASSGEREEARLSPSDKAWVRLIYSK